MRPVFSRSQLSAVCLGTSLLLATLFGSACTMDPVNAAQEAAFAAQPDEGFQADSEFHRPGQDCLACHGPRGSAEPKMLIAGTVFWGRCLDPAAGPEACAKQTVNRAEVRLVDARGNLRCIRTNCAGNFYIEEGQWSPASKTSRPLFPMLASVRKVTEEGVPVEQRMLGHIGRAGSCNDCHRTAPYWNSVGQVYLYRENDQIPSSANPEYERCRNEHVPTEPEGDCLQVPE